MSFQEKGAKKINWCQWTGGTDEQWGWTCGRTVWMPLCVWFPVLDKKGVSEYWECGNDCVGVYARMVPATVALQQTHCSERTTTQQQQRQRWRRRQGHKKNTFEEGEEHKQEQQQQQNKKKNITRRRSKRRRTTEKEVEEEQ